MSELLDIVVNTVTGFIPTPPRIDETRDYTQLNWVLNTGTFVIYIYERTEFYLEWSFFFNEGSVIDATCNSIEQLIYTVKNSSF
jgi:hypothetical protein